MFAEPFAPSEGKNEPAPAYHAPVTPRAGGAPLALLLSLAGCSASPAPPAASAAFAPTDQSKCSVSKSRARPLVVEWPSADRAALESQTRRWRGGVRYVGCEREGRPRCKAPGRYAYAALTRKRDRIVMKNEDDLYANIPVFAAKFEGKLHTAGQLNVAMTIVGQYESDRSAVEADDLEGDCAAATHVVTALTAGAFEFFAGSDDEAGVGAGALGVGAGARTAAHRELLTQDGDEHACDRASSADTRPPDGCGALLRVEVQPITRQGAPVAASSPGDSGAPSVGAPTPDRCPDGIQAVKGGSMGLPPKVIKVSPFCMDQMEVATSDYTACVKQGRCSAEGLRCGEPSSYFRGEPSLPINCVDASEAASYCALQGKRLPTEIEWEWAARGGPQALPVPWGLNPAGAKSVIAGFGGSLRTVGNSGGASADQIYNLLGNVWEWTSTEGSGGIRVLRGGSYEDTDPRSFEIPTSRSSRPGTDRSVTVGFRCAK